MSARKPKSLSPDLLTHDSRAATQPRRSSAQAAADFDVAVNVLAEDADADEPGGPGHVLGDWLAQQLQALLPLAGVQAASLSVAVVDDATMSQLHEQHLGLSGPTDVLTFDLRDPPDSPDSPDSSAAPDDATLPGRPQPTDRVEGELVLCLDEARRQAAQRGHDPRRELLLYAVHGLLHLLGEDDLNPAAAAAMHVREDALLQAIGIGPVYQSAGEGNAGATPA